MRTSHKVITQRHLIDIAVLLSETALIIEQAEDSDKFVAGCLASASAILDRAATRMGSEAVYIKYEVDAKRPRRNA